MGLSLMEFDKNWNNPVDFPTYEPDEQQVRADMQYLFDKIKNHYNDVFVVNEFRAENMPFSPTPGAIEVTNVQAAIEHVHNEVADLLLDELVLPNGSVTSEKLCQTVGEEAVITEAIQDEAITTEKIADGAVTADKLDPDFVFDASNIAERSIDGVQLKLSSVGTNEIQDNAVTRIKILNGEIVRDKIAPGAVDYDRTTGLQKVHNLVGPITVQSTDWDVTTKKVNKTVTGVSLTNVATQKVDWTPSDRASWTAVRDNGVCVLRLPPANNQVTLECDTIPSGNISLYFCIWD